jgi:hypothetical protein
LALSRLALCSNAASNCSTLTWLSPDLKKRKGRDVQRIPASQFIPLFKRIEAASLALQTNGLDS